MRTLIGTLSLLGVLSLTTLTACEDKEEECDCAPLDTAAEESEPAEEPVDTAVDPEPADSGEDTGTEDSGGE